MAKTPQRFFNKIQETKEKKLKELDLSNDWNTDDKEKLTEIPAEVFELEWLEVLNLSDNRITTLPEAITRLSQLTTLNLSYNQITTLPEAITRLSQLTTLNLSYNKITTLPEAITRLSRLTTLDLNDNQITRLPEAIIRLPQLIILNLSNNQITRLPEAITRLSQLTILYLSNNQITRLPEAITRLSQLTILYLNDNQITRLPEAITRLPQLKYLDLRDNPIETPPLEIAAKGIAAIRDYFRQLEEGTDNLYEAKLLIVGEGGAGKTTLASKIKDQNYQLQKDDSTKGIEVIRWDFPMENGREFRVNIWDFGGQEIYHATHQFFLTKRSLYVLVADNRKEDTDFYYWLNVVELLSESSPVLIIKNEKNDRTREINEPQLKGQFNNLKETLATNLAQNDQRLNNVIKEIKHQITSLPHLGTPLPKTWVKVRETLENNPRNYISLDEYLHICQQNGFTRHEDKLQLSGYLHDLGVCLHFQDDPILYNTLILKPKWGTDAVYRVLDNSQVIKDLGKFTWQKLKEIWHEQEYAEKQRELLQLMINFKLCYEIPNNPKTYIAPQLLTAKQPQYEWYETNNLILRYTYEFMPKGIITQFIVAIHNLIDVMDKQQIVWKTGVIISQEETKAEVIEYYDKREIKIRIAGKFKRDLMTKVTYELDKIHQSYKRLKYDKLIPCNCLTCKDKQDPHFYLSEKLRQFIVDQQHQIQCQKKPYQMVNVLSLIDDVMDRRELEKDKSRDFMYPSSFTFAGNIERVVIQHSTEGNNNMTEPQKPDESSKSEVQVTLPWAFRNGMFYLFVFVVVFTFIAALGGFLPFHYLALSIIGTAIFIILIGVLQLRQDDRLSEENFVELTVRVIKQFPLIGNLIESLKGNK
ncbi:leucine-rich repeat domain-containing protein [Nostoc sp. FACHB-87]|uniref:COR domain-containing protein n=1 Tax=Nostocaceae TaxID=1162 RepID=UPI001683D49E|nr:MULTISPECIES: COR domain-containing protein [Nostocaceae]MBD2457805.1 leucine-rich repeat domain-containing protein [Nostoc sp. FACHB-87]MBD2479030.1 leucine-rich repeat domain-containing protein [Anabaena sp. FACHB-83]